MILVSLPTYHPPDDFGTTISKAGLCFGKLRQPEELLFQGILFDLIIYLSVELIDVEDAFLYRGGIWNQFFKLFDFGFLFL